MTDAHKLTPREPDEAMALEPCPFCGGSAILALLGDLGDDSFVHCEKCEVQQIARYTPAGAVTRWNTRHAPSLPSNEARLREALEKIEQGSISAASTMAIEGRWQDFATALQVVAREALATRTDDGEESRLQQILDEQARRPNLQSAHAAPSVPDNIIVEEARFLCERLREAECDLADDDFGRQFSGHVIPFLARLETYLDDSVPAPADLETRAKDEKEAYEIGKREALATRTDPVEEKTA